MANNGGWRRTLPQQAQKREPDARQQRSARLQLLTELLQEGFLLLTGEGVDALAGRAMRRLLLRAQDFAE